MERIVKLNQWIVGVAVLLSATSVVTAETVAPPFDASEWYPGGSTSRGLPAGNTLLKIAGNMDVFRQEEEDLFIGRSYFRDPWLKAPTITANRDGLGPLFNMRSCIACHANGGRGSLPGTERGYMFSTFLRLSVPGKGPDGGVIPEPTYGDQLAVTGTDFGENFGLPAENRGRDDHLNIVEGHAMVRYEPIEGQYRDGESWQIHRPIYTIEDLSYGPMDPQVMTSPRMAPQIIGLGLLEAIPESVILQKSDVDDGDGDGISGRPNRVWDVLKKETVLGRFGFKANQPSVLQQTAGAFRGDIGVTNSLFPEENCTHKQVACLQAINGNDKDGVEIPDNRLYPVASFIRHLAVPKRRNAEDPQVMRGRSQFYQMGCGSCHTPSFTTGVVEGQPELSNQKIYPYTDLLLHDMGEGLADGRPDFEATGREWKTLPLWGIGLQKQVSGVVRLMHDGRARSVEEAILWHGGEAEVAKDRFVMADEADRMALLAFVDSL